MADGCWQGKDHHMGSRKNFCSLKLPILGPVAFAVNTAQIDGISAGGSAEQKFAKSIGVQSFLILANPDQIVLPSLVICYRPPKHDKKHHLQVGCMEIKTQREVLDWTFQVWTQCWLCGLYSKDHTHIDGIFGTANKKHTCIWLMQTFKGNIAICICTVADGLVARKAWNACWALAKSFAAWRAWLVLQF